MANGQYHNITISNSTLNDIQGDYYNGAPPGEYGIRKLFDASCPAAFYDSSERNPAPSCFEGTRVTPLSNIYDWISGGDERILWLFGPAGVGKTAVAQTVSETCMKNSTLAGSFFFFRGAPGRNSPDHLVASIACQIVTNTPERRMELGLIIEQNLSVFHKPLKVQFETLVTPLFNPSSSTTCSSPQPQTPSVVVIDGLDECIGEEKQQDIVRCIGEVANTSGVPLRFIIVSRPEPHIEKSFNSLACPVRRVVLEASLMGYGGTPEAFARQKALENEKYRNLWIYFRNEFNRIYQERDLTEERYWPGNEVINDLIWSSGGIFIYAATVIKYVDDPDCHPLDQLDIILNRDVPYNSTSFPAFPGIDHLYKCILGGHKDRELLLRVLTIVCCKIRPLDGPEVIDKLLELREGKTRITLRRVHSIINPKNLDIYHKTFVDFIHNKERAGEYFIDKKQGHVFMAQATMRYLSQGYKEDLPFDYAQSIWTFHCLSSGSCDDHPELLGDISKMLDTYERQKLSYEDFTSLRCSEIWSWLTVDNFIPLTNQNHPSIIQDRLFKVFWKHVDWIIIANEDLESAGLLRYSKLCPLPLAPFTSEPFPEVSGTKRPETGLYLYPKPIRSPGGTADEFQDCALKFLQDKGFEDVRIAKGHGLITRRCLEILTEVDQDGNLDIPLYSYAEKHWTNHLSQTTPGNPIVLESFKKFPCLRSRHNFAAVEIQAAQTWLKLSNVNPEEKEDLVETGWLEGLGTTDKDSPVTNPEYALPHHVSQAPTDPQALTNPQAALTDPQAPTNSQASIHMARFPDMLPLWIGRKTNTPEESSFTLHLVDLKVGLK